MQEATKAGNKIKVCNEIFMVGNFVQSNTLSIVLTIPQKWYLEPF